MSRGCTLPLRIASTRKAESQKASTKVTATSTNSGNSTAWIDILSLPEGEGGSSRSEEPGGVSGRQPGQNRFHYGVQLSIDLRIRESKNLITGAAQVLVAHKIPRSVCIETMLRSVDLDNDPRSSAFEVDNVGEQRRLPAKMMAQSPELPKLDPELHFLGRHRLAQLAGDFVGHVFLPEEPHPARCARHRPLTGRDAAAGSLRSPPFLRGGIIPAADSSGSRA